MAVPISEADCYKPLLHRLPLQTRTHLLINVCDQRKALKQEEGGVYVFDMVLLCTHMDQ